MAVRLHLDTPVIRAEQLLIYRVLLRDQPAIADLVHSMLGGLVHSRGGAGPLLDTANPSIATLVALSEALQVGVASIVDAGGDPRVVVRRSSEAPRLWTSENGSTAILRIGTDPPDLVELWDWRLLPGDALPRYTLPMPPAPSRAVSR